MRVVVPKGAVDIVANQVGKSIRPNVESRLSIEFKEARDEMLAEFNSHPVTRELEMKTAASPSSFVGEGSLFGFIGFNDNDEPVDVVRNMLKSSDLVFVRIKGAVIDFKVLYPSREELFDATPLPWAAGRSWLKGIESGLSGLGKYLNIESEASRSGGGIQSEASVRSGRFKNTAYISKILNNFIKKIEKLSL
jgi:hypothetical protein